MGRACSTYGRKINSYKVLAIKLWIGATWKNQVKME
jgi:hypothetical protein